MTSEREPPPSHDNFQARLGKARDAQQRRGGRSAKGRPSGALGVAMQMSIEMVGTLAVSVGLGWVLDDWLATGPLFLVGFFFLGAAAGGLNVYRRAGQLAGGNAGGDEDKQKPGDR